MSCENGVYFTKISNYKSVKLSELVNECLKKVVDRI